MAALKNKSKAALTIAAALALTISSVVFAAGPGGGGGGGQGGGQNMGKVEIAESIINVKLTSPDRGDLSRETEFIGKMEPSESVNVYPEISGKVSKLYYEAGDSVRAGDLLFEIDSTDAQLDYEVAQASYEQKMVSANTTLGSSYDSKLNSAEAQVKSAQQTLNNTRLKLKDYNDGYDDSLLNAEKRSDEAEQKMKEAESAYQNYDGGDDAEKKKLYTAWTEAESQYSMYYNAVKDLEDDEDSEARDLRNSYKNAQTNYQEALDSLALIQGGSLEDTKASVDVELKSASLSLEQSAAKLEKYKVYAPISGVIETKAIDLYENANTNTAAFIISNKANMMVKFNATSEGASALNAGDIITITKSGKNYNGTVVEIDSKADDSTGLFPVKANVESSDGSLLTGVSVKVTAATAKADNALLVPLDYVYYDEGQAYVYTYADGKAHRTDIEIGMSSSSEVEVTSGLDDNSQIITTWHPDLKDGATVHLPDEQSDSTDASAETAAQPDETGASSSSSEQSAPIDAGEKTSAPSVEPDASSSSSAPESGPEQQEVQ